MNIPALEIVTFGDLDSLKEMLLENGVQHQTFAQFIVLQHNVAMPSYPIIDANPDNLDDWLQIHWEIHVAEDRVLGLSTPFNLLDTDWNKEPDFYEWVSAHANAHSQRIAALGL